MVDVNLKVPAIEKLLDYVASGIGAVGGPMLARWKARAKADAMRISAEGQADSMRLIAAEQSKARQKFAEGRSQTSGEISVGEEVQARLEFQEKKRQRNIASVVSMAAEQLGEKRIENRTIDDDWAARFFGDVQDITSDHMQKMWSKILAGEVETPGRTSLHTLAILKNMTQRDAELFESVAQFIFSEALIRGENYERIHGYPDYGSLIKFEGYGLMTIVSGLERKFALESNKVIVDRGDAVYRISGGGTDPKINFPSIALSPQGVELFNLSESVINEDYLREIARFVKSVGNFNLERAPVLEKFVDGKILAGPWTIINPRG